MRCILEARDYAQKSGDGAADGKSFARDGFANRPKDRNSQCAQRTNEIMIILWVLDHVFVNTFSFVDISSLLLMLTLLIYSYPSFVTSKRGFLFALNVLYSDRSGGFK